MLKKIILISGGSDGLGKALATKLSPNHQVVILSHNEEKLKQVSSAINCDYVTADVTDFVSLKSAIEHVVEKYSRVDVLINNAGIWMQGLLEEGDQKQITEVIMVNTLGTIFLTKLVIPIMKSQKSGRIINIISQDGLHSKKERSVYSASKWAITGFTKCLQEDLSEDKIGVTGIYPGLMKTRLFEKQGITRDLNNSLDLSEVSTLVEFVINLPPETLIPDIGIKNINNPTNMDDTISPPIGLDINPDLMTTQTGIPATPPTIPPVSFDDNKSTSPSVVPPARSGVIDITPGAKDEYHPTAVIDITPSVSSSVSTPGITLPVDQGVIDITPDEKPAPVVDSSSGLAHLADIVPQPSTASTPATAPSEPVVTTTTTTAAEIPVTPVSAPPVNPLQEDPDSVTLVK